MIVEQWNNYGGTLEKSWWNSRTSESGTVKQIGEKIRTSHGGRVEYLMVE